MSFRILAIFVLVALGFMLLSWGCWKGFRTIHTRGRKIWAAAAIVSNLFWIALPFIATERLTPEFRIIRSVLAPPWFYWLSFSLLYGSLLLILLILWRVGFRRDGLTFGRFGRPFSYVFLVASAVVTVVGVYQALVPLRVERVQVVVDDLDPGLEGTTFALVSDLHVGMFSRLARLHQISRAVDGLDADYVIACGDLIDDDPVFVPKFLEGLAPLRHDTPILAVLGNHEIYGDPSAVRESLEGSRVDLLFNEGRGVLQNEAILWLAGISDFAGRDSFAPDIDAALRGRPEGAFTVLFSHQPRAFAPAVERDVDLVLAGHTHGGQFGVRSLGWSLAGVFLPRDMGLYREKNTQMFITTGAGYWVVPMRFGMSPEVVLVELTRGR
jgi:predicted MPP superfamily phosphohydrolase